MPGLTNFYDYRINMETAHNELVRDPETRYEQTQHSPTLPVTGPSLKDVKFIIVLGLVGLGLVYLKRS